MRSTRKGIILKVSVIVFAVVVCIGATAINKWQARPGAESWPAGGGGMSSFVPTSTTALW